MKNIKRHNNFVRQSTACKLFQSSGKAALGSLFLALSFFVTFSAQAQSGSSSLEVGSFKSDQKYENLEPEILDFRYSPLYWHSSIGLPDDPHKTVIDSEGDLFYDYGNEGPYRGFHIQIGASLNGSTEYTPVHQNLYDSRTPVVKTEENLNGLILEEEAWAKAPENDNVDEWAPRRVDYMWLKLKNKTTSTKTGQIKLQIASTDEFKWDGNTLVKKDNADEKVLTLSTAYQSTSQEGDSLVVLFPEKELSPKGEYDILITLYPGKFAKAFNRDEAMYKQYETYHNEALKIKKVASASVKDAAGERDKAIEYWHNVKMPYDKIHVPDASVQRLLDSSIRNIYQARELSNGKPVFQVGPTVYRGSWAADGPFFMEAFTYLGEWKEVRDALGNQVNADTGPGGIEFSKKAGLRLWMISRHIELTGESDWVDEIWPKVERDVELIKKYRRMSREDDTPLNDGLLPKGFGDGGLRGPYAEYTNIYWTLAGLNAAVQVAEELGKPEAADWKSEYEDYWQAFDKARERDKAVDAHGNVYVPPTMTDEYQVLPQRGAWAFMHSIFPGKIYDRDDALMRGTMDMLDATQQEGLIYGTGWLSHGIWNYAGSFYSHAHLWLGHGRKAATTFYAFGNHASPVLTWREEQYPVGQMRGQDYVGDMPHNWASAEFIRLVRHFMILERGEELHLLEGLPKAWARPGDETKLNDIATTFGNMSLSVKIADDGQSADIKITPPTRRTPEKIVVHLEQFPAPIWEVTSGDEYFGTKGSVEISGDKPVTLHVEFEHSVETRYSQPQD